MLNACIMHGAAEMCLPDYAGAFLKLWEQCSTARPSVSCAEVVEPGRERGFG